MNELRLATSAACVALLLYACSGGTGNGSAGPELTGWLHTGAAQITADGGPPVTTKRILQSDGSLWMGRGANLYDTRSCDACSFDELTPGQIAEVNRRADALIGWGANYIHLVMDSYAQSGGRVQYRNVLQDPAYLDSIKQIVEHITDRKVYVLLYLHNDPCLAATPSTPDDPINIGSPTPACDAIWQLLATTFRENPYVQYGLAAEPTNSQDGEPNDCSSAGHCTSLQVRDAFDREVGVIRAIEASLRPDLPTHLIAVQGTEHWGRELAVYLAHPITAGGGENVIYEVHPYNKAADFDRLVFSPARTLPVIVGEFGPVAETPGDPDTPVADQDLTTLISRAEVEKVPYLAWNFHQYCPPNLLVDHRLDAGAPEYDLCESPPRPGLALFPLDPAPYSLTGPHGSTWGQLLRDAMAAAP